MNQIDRLDLARFKINAQFGMELMNVFLIPLIAADVIQTRIMAMTRIETPLIGWWLLLFALAFICGTIMIKAGIIQEEMTMTRLFMRERSD